MTLLACGGDGASSSPTTTTTTSFGSPEGVYAGTTSSTTSPNFQMLVLENNDVWTLYGTQSSSQFLVRGFIQAIGNASGGNYASTVANDFSASGVVGNGAVSATYNNTAGTISGAASITGSGSVSFSGGPISSSTYNYNTAALISSIQGAWSLSAITGESLSINIASTGSFTALSGLGCNFSGTISPRSSGKNVFNVAMTFGSSPCALPGQSATGIALSYPVTGGRNQLLIAGFNTTRTAGTAAFGIR